MRITLLFVLLVFSLSIHGQGIIDNYNPFSESDPYTPGTNEFAAMNGESGTTGDKDSPDSTLEWEGLWTPQGGSSAFSVENTIVRTGTTSLQVDGATSTEGVRSFGWNPAGQGPGVDWTWEGFAYVPTGTTTAQLEIHDALTGTTVLNLLTAPDFVNDAFFFASFEHNQTSGSTFSMRIKVNGTLYLDDMKWVNTTP